MSEHMKKRPIKTKKAVLCVSEEGQVYEVSRSVLDKYRSSSDNYQKARQLVRNALSVTPEEVFAEINAKYTKTGALLRAIRLREGLNQKMFAQLIGVTQGDLSKMEHGKRPIGKLLTARIAKKFGSRL